MIALLIVLLRIKLAPIGHMVTLGCNSGSLVRRENFFFLSSGKIPHFHSRRSAPVPYLHYSVSSGLVCTTSWVVTRKPLFIIQNSGLDFLFIRDSSFFDLGGHAGRQNRELASIEKVLRLFIDKLGTNHLFSKYLYTKITSLWSPPPMRGWKTWDMFCNFS